MKVSLSGLLLLLLINVGVAMAEDFSALRNSHPIWLQRNIKWERVPLSVNPKLSCGPAVSVYFGEGGDFRMLSGTVCKQDGRISASAGDAESIFRGEWVLEGDNIHVSYRLVYRDVGPKGEQLPGPVQEVNFKYESKRKLLKAWGSRGLDFGGFEFEVNEKLDTASVEDHIQYTGKSNPG